MNVLGQEEVVEQDLETGEQIAAASEQPSGDEPTGDAEGAASAEKPEGEQKEGQDGAAAAGQEDKPALSAEAQLAAEALAATEELEPAAGQETVPVSVVAELRADRRASRQLVEALQSQLAEKTKPVETAPEISPLRKWVIENPEDAQVSAPPGTVLLAQQEWQEQQAESKAQVQVTRARTSKGEASYAQAKGTLTDFDEIVELGSNHLSPGDKLDIAMSQDPAMELYKRCQRATLQSGTPDAAVMRTHLQAKLAKSKTSVSPAKNTVTVNNKQKQAPASPPAERYTAVRNPRLAQVLDTFGI